VWDGDQILYEISSPGATSATVAQLEQDTAQVNDYVADEEPYGRVAYTHGAALDAPLGLVRVNFSPVFPEPTLIVPLANWQGQYDMGIAVLPISGPVAIVEPRRRHSPETGI